MSSLPSSPNPIPETEPNPNAPPSHPQTTANKPPPTVTDALGGDLATGLSTVHGASSEMLGGDLASGLSTVHGASSEMLGGDLASGLSTVHGASSQMLGGDLASGLSTAHGASSVMLGGDLATGLSTVHGASSEMLGGDLATGLSTVHGASSEMLGGDLASGLSTAHGASSVMLGGDLATGLSTAHGASSVMLGGDLATGLSTVHSASSEMLGGDLATGLSTAHGASSEMLGGDLTTGLSTAHGAMSEMLCGDLATGTVHGASSKSVGAGIRNSGNTSFLSAILQCFTHTVPMFRGLRSCTHASPCDVKSFCVICAFRNHFDDALKPSGVPVVPREITENLDFFLAGYVSGKQEEDAHEFMQSALKELQKGFPVGEENLIDQVFRGQFVDTFRCCCCRGYSSATFVPFTEMSLEIELAASIPHALKSITRVEQLVGKFRCSDCNQEVTMEKQLMLDIAPSIAVFHLKRFLKDGDSWEKIERSLWLHKKLNLNPYTSGSSSDNVVLNYELYAVVVHRGPSPNSGHYFCFVRSAPDKWYLMDDDKVSSVSEEEALNHRAADHKAYILFYAKEGTPWFSTIVEKDDNDSTADPNEEDHDNNGAEDDNVSTDASYSWLRKMGERRALEENEPCECSNM